jgi:hypothetical protein
VETVGIIHNNMKIRKNMKQVVARVYDDVHSGGGGALYSYHYRREQVESKSRV